MRCVGAGEGGAVSGDREVEGGRDLGVWFEQVGAGADAGRWKMEDGILEAGKQRADGFGFCCWTCGSRPPAGLRHGFEAWNKGPGKCTLGHTQLWATVKGTEGEDLGLKLEDGGWSFVGLEAKGWWFGVLFWELWVWV